MRPNSRLASEDVPPAVRDEHETPGVEPLAVSLIGLENEAARGDLLSRAGEHGAGAEIGHEEEEMVGVLPTCWPTER